MGSAFSSGWSGQTGVPVVLNVYDLTPLNNYLIWFGLGIFHSAVEVHGMEYSFGYHDLSYSGVFEVPPKQCPGYIYRCSIVLGRTNLSPDEFRKRLEDMATNYFGDTYHLITKNCNHFTDDLSWNLTNRGIPGWVNRLARLGALCNCCLPDYMRINTPTKQIHDLHCSEEGSNSSSEYLDREEVDEKLHLLPSTAGEVTVVKEAPR